MTFLEDQRGGSTSNAILVIRNEEAIRVDHFGRLLTEIEKDYRKFGGGTLAVGRVANGSLHFEFHELVATSMSFMPYIKAVVDLTALAIKGGSAATEIFGKSNKRRGARTVENLARIAVNSNARCSLEYRSGFIREHLVVTVDPHTGRQIVDVANASRVARLDMPQPIPPDRLAERLSSLSERAIALRGTRGADQDELRSLIQIVVDTLRDVDAEDQVRELIRRLRHQGLDDVAQLFDDALTIGRSSR